MYDNQEYAQVYAQFKTKYNLTNLMLVSPSNFLLWKSKAKIKNGFRRDQV